MNRCNCSLRLKNACAMIRRLRMNGAEARVTHINHTPVPLGPPHQKAGAYLGMNLKMTIDILTLPALSIHPPASCYPQILFIMRSVHANIPMLVLFMFQSTKSDGTLKREYPTCWISSYAGILTTSTIHVHAPESSRILQRVCVDCASEGLQGT